MNKVTIQWHDLDDESQDNLENYTGFYVLVAENVVDEESDEVEILEIGMAYKENILDKIEDPEEAYEFLPEYFEDNPEMDIFFMMGNIKSSTVNPLTTEFLREVQCLLINHNEPLFNEDCEEQGEKKPLEIENTGDFQPLEETSEIN